MAWQWQTLVTDASYDQPGVAGWGAWAKADGIERSTSASGIIDVVRVGNNNDAELAAALYGLRTALAYAPGRNVLLQSDSMHVLRVLKVYLGLGESTHRDGKRIVGGEGQDIGDVQRRLLDMFRDAYWEAQVSVVLRHVKGHHSDKTGRHWCNQVCDRGARLHMHQARELMLRGIDPSVPVAVGERVG